MEELDDEDTKGLKNFIRMDRPRSSCLDLMDKVSPLVSKEDTTMRQAISAGEWLAVTLCYLLGPTIHIKNMLYNYYWNWYECMEFESF